MCERVCECVYARACVQHMCTYHAMCVCVCTCVKRLHSRRTGRALSAKVSRATRVLHVEALGALLTLTVVVPRPVFQLVAGRATDKNKFIQEHVSLPLAHNRAGTRPGSEPATEVTVLTLTSSRAYLTRGHACADREISPDWACAVVKVGVPLPPACLGSRGA